MKSVKQGAEATLTFQELDGKKVVVKERLPKRYRLREIDDRIRSSRTKEEIKLMREARGHGVLTPRIVDSGEYRIVMEDVGGRTAKDVLDSGSPAVCRKMGESVGRLHASGIVHGDLTTSNIMVRGGDVYLVDFGLGKFARRAEDMATDLRLFKETLDATHPKLCKRCWLGFKSGYSRGNGKSGEVFTQMEKIAKRGRYRER